MDLREFIDNLKQAGELYPIDQADWNLEIGAISELSAEREGPALLFDKIKGYPEGYRVLANAISTPRQLAIALGLPSDVSRVELVRLIKEKFDKLKPVPPIEVSDGPVLENIQDSEKINLLTFPVPKWHEYDGGRYIGTGDMVIMRDKEKDWVNAGTYRVQVHDENTLGIFIAPGHHGRLISEKYWTRGESCPVAIVFGVHPRVLVPACISIPWGTSEYDTAGALLGEPLRVVRGERTGLPIPADAEIVVEGECPPPEVESKEEGPFGEWTGYYAGGRRKEPVIKVKRVMYRNSPILIGIPPLKPPATAIANYLIRAANVWKELERLGIAGIQSVFNLKAGGTRYITVICIKQKYAGHAKQVAMATLSGQEGAFHSRIAIVVDEDIDPSNVEEVLWAVATRCDPATALEVVTGCWSTALDPVLSPEKRIKGDMTSSRVMINACRPFHWMKEFPRVNRASDELRKATRDKWKDLFKS